MIQVKLTRKGKAKVKKLKAKLNTVTTPVTSRTAKATNAVRTIAALGLGRLTLAVAPKSSEE